MEKINNILQALDKALEQKDLDIFVLKMEVERLEGENTILKNKIAEMKGETYEH